jgi:peptide/nickel transport system substrate-binding protein
VDKQLSGSVNTSSSILASNQLNCSFTPSEYNPEKAKALLEEAGWKVGSDGIREKEGQRLSLKIMTEKGSDLRANTEEAISSDLKQVGIELLAENVPPKEFNGSWKAGSPRKHGHFDILLLASGPGINPLVGIKRDFHTSRIPTAYNQGSGNNFSRYSNNDVDAWIDQAFTITNSQQQQDLLCKIAEQINKDAPVIPLYEHLIVSARLARLQNFVISPGPANFTFESQNWWLKP